jgi:nitrate/nitrite-specific signal transduction histidine kinase
MDQGGLAAKRGPTGPPFPGRLGRSLTLALGAVVLVVLVVGGTSLALAFRIHANNEAVMREHGHIRRADEIHLLFHDLVLELHQAEASTAAERTARARRLDEDLERHVVELARLHPGEQDEDEREKEKALVAELRRVGDEAGALVLRTEASGRFTERDIHWLDGASQLVPRTLDGLASLHRTRIERRLEDTRDSLRVIVFLYAAFLVAGGTLLAAASAAAHRSIVVPLGKLSDAAREIAEGGLGVRVGVRSSNEIGQLCHSFNVMADGLQTRERELRAAHGELEEKVRETQALYRIGTDISRLHHLDRILQSVVDKARELLRGDAATLCLFTPGRDRCVTRATSGPPEAFRPESTTIECQAMPAGCAAPVARPCPVIRPEFARTRLAAALRLGDDDMGAIHVSSREERAFTQGEAELLAGLATQAAIAIERARLSEELRGLAAVEERVRIAREMHDGLAQVLGLLHIKLQDALARASDAPALAESLREMAGLTDQAYEDVRQSIFELRTFVSRGLGLVPTLTEYLHEFSAQSGIAVELDVPEGAFDPLPPPSEVQAVRIIQEALSNLRKHARASRATVRLRRDGAWVRVAVEDDGVGWDPKAAPHPLHFGLQTMRERAEGLGGRLEIDAAPGRGTRVVALLPAGGA